jgi:hypothetical protein
MAMALQEQRTAVKTISGLDGLAGLWLIAAPFVLGYSAFATAMWNDVIAGAAVLILAASRTMGDAYKVAWPSWVNAAIGVWLIIAPFALSYPTGSVAMTNDIIVGLIIAGLAAWSALITPKEMA